MGRKEKHTIEGMQDINIEYTPFIPRLTDAEVRECFDKGIPVPLDKFPYTFWRPKFEDGKEWPFPRWGEEYLGSEF